ncbi:YjbH domain-containing protein [Herbaspirillum sp. SJZ107]|uniref:YjbH domain-containing protein n=1 Tax=Herbaspirillum sp. SJZ107 TaxID=2572881 RepID=UPI00116F4657|nr:YjbH domain-containing protein [Herbaspirillum sp. SJZ107]TQK07483.1 membrane-associated phospholipid phosphatase [Herbaspirillum sp. SJZ107]
MFTNVFKHTLKFSCLMLGAAQAFGSTPSLNGQSGYINMPSAWTEPDGTFSVGYSFDNPYGSLWVTSTVLPFLQMTGRYVSINGIPGFSSDPNAYGGKYGRYKDKVIDGKLRLWEESKWAPQIAVGRTDIFGTELFRGNYIVATKTFGSARNIEASIGYGQKRPDGLFAGVRWVPLSAPRWAAVLEYDANDYSKDFQASKTAAGARRKGPAIGLEYRWGWLGAQVARHRDHFSANAFMSIPFSEREFIPKLFEPAYFQPKQAPARVSAAEWQQSPAHTAGLVDALAKQDFKNIRVELDGTTLRLALTNSRISNLGRAVGRAARTALAFAPEGTRSLQITYTKLEQPIATYEFLDTTKLTDYLTGLSSRDDFLTTVSVRYSTPADKIADRQELLSAVREEGSMKVQVGRDGEMVQLLSEDRESNRLKIMPKMGFFFNDPSGALRYDLAAAGVYDKRLRPGLYMNSVLWLDVLENVSGVTQKSNSLLPHVRTDVAEYKRGSRFKVNRLMLNQYLNPDERVYARLSGGLYEEMYRGVGGQVLYLPRDSRWATDLSIDALQQRDFKGLLGKRDYQTVTAIAALHYKLPYDITVTARAGRFLARDEGVRMEFKRRFASGMEIGAWYTKTNGNDITTPGTPSKPYNDRGVFLSIPLNIMLPLDSQANAGLSISPWTRDVGQMVASPGDLYDMMEQPRRDMTSYDGLGNFAERADEQNLPAVVRPSRPMANPWPAFRQRIEQSVSTTPTLPQWANGALLGSGALAAGALLDRPVDRFMRKHAGSGITRAWGNVGKALPVALAGASGAAVAFGDARMQNIGIISLESIAGAIAVSETAKRIVGRARPDENLGQWERAPKRSDSSFPSNHSTIAFAAVTPFAQEYDAPWLYGLAAAGAMGRTANRQHWVSDVVAGGLVGYAMGSWLWQSQRTNRPSSFAITPSPKQISVAWTGTY